MLQQQQRTDGHVSSLDNTFLGDMATETRGYSAQTPPGGARTGTDFCVINFSIVPVAPLIEHSR